MKKTLTNKELDSIPAKQAESGKRSRQIVAEMLDPNCTKGTKIKPIVNKKKK